MTPNQINRFIDDFNNEPRSWLLNLKAEPCVWLTEDSIACAIMFQRKGPVNNTTVLSVRMDHMIEDGMKKILYYDHKFRSSDIETNPNITRKEKNYLRKYYLRLTEGSPKAMADRKKQLTKEEWDFLVCPAEIAEKVLTAAGYSYEGCKIYEGQKSTNPFTGKKEVAVTWRTVANRLKDKGVITLGDQFQCTRAVKEYYAKLMEGK